MLQMVPVRGSKALYSVFTFNCGKYPFVHCAQFLKKEL